MILEYDTDDKKRLVSQLGSSDTVAGPSSTASEPEPVASLSSPTESNPAEHDHLLIEMVPTEPPPNFAPYQAEHFEVGYEDIVSHDPHLNSDGEALYRFLLAQSASPPTYRLHCNGNHTETRTRWVSHRDSQGRSRNRHETYNETVTDFDFCIDITPGAVDAGHAIAGGSSNSRGNAVAPVQWSIPDDEPAYRGKMWREYEVEPYNPHVAPTAGSNPRAGPSGEGRRQASRTEGKMHKKWVEKRAGLGFPPWVREADVENRLELDPAGVSTLEGDALRSSKTLRQWADEYCASPKYLKEFVYEKVAYGWNMQQIEIAVRATIQATPYHGNLNITLVPHNTKIYIRPNNRVSRWLSNKWLTFISITLFIYPFVWLFKRFHSCGGGRWEVCGGAYPLKQWVPVQAGSEEAQAAQAAAERADAESDAGIGGDVLPPYSDVGSGPAAITRTMSSGSRWFSQTPTGPKKLIGVKEGEWFKAWEGAIIRAVHTRYQSTTPLPRSARSNPHARSLDGYEDAPPSQLVDY